MTKREKCEFRMSPEWRRYRIHLKRKHHAIDAVTGQPLRRNWHLHHLDLRDSHYTDLSDSDRFLPVNEETHAFIHWLWRLWRRNRNMLLRLEHVMQMMEEYSND